MTDDKHPPQLPDPSSSVHRVELMISTLLRLGVSISLAVVVIGTIVSFVHHPDYLRSAGELNGLTTPGKAAPHSLQETIAGIKTGHGQAIIMAGLLLLVATPVLRVAVSIFAFVIQRDWVFVLITTVVLGFLVLSFFLGKAGG